VRSGRRCTRGEWSRLVADLNRSEDHPRVVAGLVDGRVVPGNQLDDAALQRRLRTYWRPYRRKTEQAITAAAWRAGVLHLSVHSFTPKLGGVERRNDVGLCAIRGGRVRSRSARR
jgi:predicted N-formylglutamate amidohydrolase